MGLLDEVTEYSAPVPGGREPLAVDDETAAGDGRVPGLSEVEIPDELREELEEIRARYPDRRSASIPSLWAIQRREGWCRPEGIRQAAAVLEVTPAFLEGVASFYDLLRLEPVGSNRVVVCTNIACWMRGADSLLAAVCEAAGADPVHAVHGGASSEDGELFVTGYECMGACDLAPMAAINERYYGPLTDADAATIVSQLRSGAAVLPDRELAKRPAAGGPEPPPDPRVANG
jgi:NADH:ubiquinone oxidoreductase subunit E